MLIQQVFLICLIAHSCSKASALHFWGLQTSDWSCCCYYYVLYFPSFSDFFLPRVGTGEEQAAVTIASVQQAAAFGDHNIQYQFRTEGGQVRN